MLITVWTNNQDFLYYEDFLAMLDNIHPVEVKVFYLEEDIRPPRKLEDKKTYIGSKCKIKPLNGESWVSVDKVRIVEER